MINDHAPGPVRGRDIIEKYRLVEIGKGLHARCLDVDGYIATELLQLFEVNRSSRRVNLQKLCSDIDRGLWKNNGATIVFDLNGVGLDGEHRLKAVIKTKGCVAITVIVGAESGAAVTYDSGAKRSMRELIELDVVGARMPKAIGGFSFIAFTYKDNATEAFSAKASISAQSQSKQALIMQEAMDFLGRHFHRRVDSVTTVPSIAAICRAYYACKDNQKELDSLSLFCKSMVDIDKCPVEMHSTIHQLGKYLVRRTMTENWTNACKAIQRCIRAFIEGQRLKKIRVPKRHTFFLPDEMIDQLESLESPRIEKEYNALVGKVGSNREKMRKFLRKLENSRERARNDEEGDLF